MTALRLVITPPSDATPIQREGRIPLIRVELLLGALAACLMKSIERVVSMLKFGVHHVAVTVRAQRQEAPPQSIDLACANGVASAAPEPRLELLHQNVRKDGTVLNMLAAGTAIPGTLWRKQYRQGS